MTFNPNMPYNDLPLLPPGKDLETKAVLKQTIAAAKALAQLKGAANSIPNPEILINSITLQEAKSSSEIENIITTNDELYRAFSVKSKDFNPATKEVLRYRESLWSGFNELKKKHLLTTNLFVKVYQRIKETEAGIRKTPGTKLADGQKRIIYTPPEGETRLRQLLHNLEQYMHKSDDVDPLIKSTVIHYQFESIHPFSDGNGRTGRILLILYLVLTDYLDLPILYLSKFIIENKSDYYRLLRSVTEKQDWEFWILYLLRGIEQTSLYTINLINKIYQSLRETFEYIKNSQGRVPKEVIELIYEQPYCKTEFITKKDISTRKTAGRYLKELVRLNILEPEKVGKEVIYLNTKLYHILSEK